MIPGDIDLTENLDFRKVVKKQLPKLPYNWNGEINNIKLNVNNNLSMYIDNVSTELIQRNTTIVNYRYHIQGQTSSSYYIDLSDQPTYLFSDSYNIYYSSSLTSSNRTYSTSSLNKLTISINNDDEYDVFGNKINKICENIPKIPWKNKRDYVFSNSIPWYNNSRFIYEDYCDDDIPWDIDYDDEADNQCSLDSIYDKAKNLISWLSNKQRTFINNYFDEKEVNLSYLTNMSWIGVHDAII